MKRIEKLALDDWKATGWDDFATGYPVWHEGYLEGYRQALEDAAWTVIISTPGDQQWERIQRSTANFIAEAILALADEDEAE